MKIEVYNYWLPEWKVECKTISFIELCVDFTAKYLYLTMFNFGLSIEWLKEE